MRNCYGPSWRQAGDMHAFALISQETKWSIWEQRCTAGQSPVSLLLARKCLVLSRFCSLVGILHQCDAHLTHCKELKVSLYFLLSRKVFSIPWEHSSRPSWVRWCGGRRGRERALVPRGGKGRRCSSAKLNNSDLASDGGEGEERRKGQDFRF